jgi:hypothetical protein
MSLDLRAWVETASRCWLEPFGPLPSQKLLVHGFKILNAEAEKTS